jgi:signal peptidase II
MDFQTMKTKTVLPRRKRLLPLGLITGLCILTDQTAKQLAAAHLSPLLSQLYLRGLVRLVYAENSGMFSSLGVELSVAAKFWLFTVGVGLVLTGLLIYLLAGTRVNRGFLIGGALVLGGGLSNLLDRLLNQGLVIDFIYLVIDGWISDVFNLADLAISVGSVILLLAWIRRSRETPQST